MADDQFLKDFKKNLPEYWANKETGFDFGVAAYLQGRIDERRALNPEYTTIYNLLRNTNVAIIEHLAGDQTPTCGEAAAISEPDVSGSLST